MLKRNYLAMALIAGFGFAMPHDLYAVTFITFDPKSMAMGGAGVAVGEPGDTALLNPALALSDKQELKDTSYAHAYVGARLIDRENFIDRVKALEDDNFESSLDQALIQFRQQFRGGSLSANELRDLGLDANKILQGIESVSNRPLRASASAGFSMGRTGTDFTIGMFTKKYIVIGAEVNLSSIDVDRMQQLITATNAMANVIDSSAGFQDLIDALDLDVIEDLVLQSVADQRIHPALLNYADIPGVENIISAITASQADIANLLALISIDDLQQALMAQNGGASLPSLNLDNIDPRNFLRYQALEEFESTVDYSGAEVDEYALTIATNKFLSEKLSVGINLKAQSIDIIELSQPFDSVDFGAYKLRNNRNNYLRVNVDLGSVYRINEHYSVALVIRNAIPFSLKSTLGNTVDFDPIARVGFGYKSETVQLALDYDLTSNEPLGFDPDKRYISAGAEFALWNKNALRIGYRYNTVDSTGLPSIGFGLGFRQGHVDLAVARSPTNDEYGASLHLGFQF